MTEPDVRLVWAEHYVARGWPVFVLGYDKRPVANCAACHRADFMHNMDACTCLGCHGFYAATLDVDRVRRMCELSPGLLAVRTGAASGIMVLDAEGHDKDDDGQTGVELITNLWEGFTGQPPLPETLKCRTASGGLHLFYRYVEGTTGRNRTLPNVDLKSDGGYVALPCGLDAREWLNQLEPADLGSELLTYLRARRLGGGGGGSGHTGYDFEAACRDGPAAGIRDEFWRDWSFKRRKAGWSREAILREGRAIWERMDQDDRDPWPWDWVMYKVDRDQLKIQPDASSLGPGQTDWVRRITNVTGSPAPSGTGAGGDGVEPPHRGPLFINEPPPFETECTHTGNAHRFVRLFQERALFVPGLGWHVWDGNVWRLDELNDVLDMTHEVLLKIRSEQEEAAGDEERARQLRGWYVTSSGAEARVAMLKLAATDPRMKAAPRALNANPWSLVVHNGTVDLRTGKLRDSLPSDLNTRQAAVTFDAEATCPAWLEHVRLISRVRDRPDADWQAFLQRWAGYTLTGSAAAQKFFFGFGSGNNGKNVFMETLLEILGDYGIRAASKLLLGSGQEHETVVADLAGARMAFMDETPKGRINEARIKELTGSKRIRARKIAKDSFEFDMQAKLWIAGNHKPKVADTTDGFWRRLDLVPFDSVIEAERRVLNYSDVLLSEASGILNWCLVGLASYLELGNLGAPQRVIDAGQSYRDEENTLDQFVEDCFDTVTTMLHWTPNPVIHAVFAQWCQAQGITQVRTMPSLAHDLEAVGFVRDRAKYRVAWAFANGTRPERGWFAPPLLNAPPAQVQWSPTESTPVPIER